MKALCFSSVTFMPASSTCFNGGWWREQSGKTQPDPILALQDFWTNNMFLSKWCLDVLKQPNDHMIHVCLRSTKIMETTQKVCVCVKKHIYSKRVYIGRAPQTFWDTSIVGGMLRNSSVKISFVLGKNSPRVLWISAPWKETMSIQLFYFPEYPKTQTWTNTQANRHSQKRMQGNVHQDTWKNIQKCPFNYCSSSEVLHG